MNSTMPVEPRSATYSLTKGYEKNPTVCRMFISSTKGRAPSAKR